eukprot:jgi/Mesen1/10991/ME000097S10576
MASSSRTGVAIGLASIRRVLNGSAYGRQLEASVPSIGHATILHTSQRRQYGDAMESTAASPDDSGLIITDGCVRRLEELRKEEGNADLMLRLSVEGGGCSGFQYTFTLDTRQNPDDRVVEKDGAKVLVDDISFSFVKGATVDFGEELIRSAFQVVSNPNSASSCGCGTSFTAK